jgi:hypothetical protein
MIWTHLKHMDVWVSMSALLSISSSIPHPVRSNYAPQLYKILKIEL